MNNKFNVIVSFFAEMGWQSLGKITNPMTGKIEKILKLQNRLLKYLKH